MSQTPPDWYPDPSDSANVRYWDGTAWTTLTRPVAAAPPPPAMSAAAASPKKSRAGLWITLSAVGLVVVGLGIAGAAVVAEKFAGISADYTGAPVTNADVAPAGTVLVISTSETVAAEVPSRWRDFEDYFDFEAEAGEMPPGASFLGGWFTHEPGTTASSPQLVMAMEMTPAAAGPGTLGDIRNQYLSGMGGSLQSLDFGVSLDYTTPLGLEGTRIDGTFWVEEENHAGAVAVVVVAHGRRFVVVQWTSYDAPIDEQSLDAFMASLRVDP